MRTGVVVVALVMWNASLSISQVWERISLPGQFAQGYYLDVYFLPSNPQYGWACGYQGYVVRTTDGGRSWQGSIVPYNGRAGGHLESVHFVDLYNGYTSGPAGVFRSTDGGISWTDITPSFPNEGPWGCYFLTSTIGVVLGGGCIGAQNFFHTTNAGQTWTLFQSNQLGSGLTDAILYTNGSGYAVSSGRLWITSNGGLTWDLWRTIGPAYWHEELAVRGNSFLVPWAGNTCSGQGPGGGGRFSINAGQTWQSFSTNAPMFGAWLHDTVRGWICGFARNVWYTSNGGANWAYRGCGTEGDLDDIWMVTDTIGFVVGEGIYRYAPPQRSVSKRLLDFGSNCPPVIRFDTLFVRNRSWNGESVRIAVIGQNSTAFNVIQPVVQPAAIASCDSLMVVVRYQPASGGLHGATLRVEFIGTTDTLSVPLRGERIDRGIVPNDTLVESYGVEAGKPVSLRLALTNQTTQTGQLLSMTRISGTPFAVIGEIPRPVPTTGGTVDFTFTPPDTGWYTARFRMRTDPCQRDTTITVRIYAVSPIITAQAPVLNAACAPDKYDSVRITNTGNADLIITNLTIEPLDAPLSIVGTSRGIVPVHVPPRESLWVYIRFVGTGSGNSILVVEHNDRTMARQVERPLRILLPYSAVRPRWQHSPSQLDFGTLCVGQTARHVFELRNTGVSAITVNAVPPIPFIVETPLPLNIGPSEKRDIEIRFVPTQAGTWSVPLMLYIEPCGLVDTLRLHGVAETTDIVLMPSEVRVQLFVSEQTVIPIVVHSVGTTASRLVRAELTPLNPQWNIISSFPRRVRNNEMDTVWLSLTAGSQPGVIRGKLCLVVDSLCSAMQCIDISLTVLRRELTVTPSDVVFQSQHCRSRIDEQSVWLTNTGDADEQISAAWIEPPNAPFALVLPSRLPLTVKAGDRLELRIRYSPQQEGLHQAELVLESSSAWAQTRRVPLQGSFKRVETSLLPQQIDLGVLEPCSGVQNLVVTFSSVGLLSDTLHLVEFPTLQGWNDRTTVERIITSPGGVATVTIQFNPTQAQLGMSQRAHFRWQSLVCPAHVELNVDYSLVRPLLAYTPRVVNWHRQKQGVSSIRGVLVTNPSVISRTIEHIIVTPQEGEADVRVRVKLPLLVKPGDHEWLSLEMTPRSVGTFRADLQIVERSVCWDTTSITILAEIEQEHYWARMAIDRHVMKVGDVADIPIVLTTRDNSDDALWKAQPLSIGFQLEFDPYIIDVLGARVGATGPPVHVERRNGNVTVTVPSDAVEQLGASGTLATLTILGLQSPPLQSSLRFVRTWAETLKPYTIENQDGLVLLDACVAWMKVALNGTLALSVVPTPSDGFNPPQIVTDAEQAQPLRCMLYGFTGQLLHQWELSIPRGQQKFMIPFRFPGGVFYLVAESMTSGQRVLIPIVVAR